MRSFGAHANALRMTSDIEEAVLLLCVVAVNEVLSEITEAVANTTSAFVVSEPISEQDNALVTTNYDFLVASPKNVLPLYVLEVDAQPLPHGLFV